MGIISFAPIGRTALSNNTKSFQPFSETNCAPIILERSIDAVRNWQARDSVAVFSLVEVTRWVKLNSGL
jgi:hypothetical protein